MSGRRRYRLWVRHIRSARVALAITVIAASLFVPSGVAAAAASPPRDTITAGGYDFDTELPADVIAGSKDNNLVYRYRSNGVLTDGTITISLPARAWPTPLRALERLIGNPSDNGGVVVRPLDPAFPPGPGDCTGTGDTPISWRVVNHAAVRTVVVRHLSCTPGQQIAVRIYGVTAPTSIGRHRSVVAVFDQARLHLLATPTTTVVRVPTTHLAIDVPASPQLYASTSVTVRALTAGGEVDTSYRGSVALRAVDDNGCGIGSPDQTMFTAADAGVRVIPVKFQSEELHVLETYDIGHKALPGTSGYVTAVGMIQPTTCSTSFH